MNETLDRHQAAALQRLLSSPMAQKAAEQHEAARATQRAAILAELAEAEPPAVEAAEAAGAIEAAALIRVQEARQALRVAQAELNRASYAALCTSEALERTRSNAASKLRPLGGDRIDATHRAVLFELQRTRSSLQWQTTRDHRGVEVGTTAPADAELARLAHLEKLAAELEQLRLSPLSPAELEARCGAIESWIASNAAPPKPAEPSRWRGWFKSGHEPNYGGWTAARS